MAISGEKSRKKNHPHHHPLNGMAGGQFRGGTNRQGKMNLQLFLAKFLECL